MIELKKTRILFMGTSTFSREVLQRLIDENYNIVGVVTQPDRYVGRKKILKMPEVKELALEHQIPVLQYDHIKDGIEDIKEYHPDIMITAAYGQIIPKTILELPTIAAINVHASLLPKYRGAAPVHQAIIDGEEKTGVTIMYMVSKMDAGNIISQKEIAIKDDDTVGELYDSLAFLGADLLVETLPDIISGTNASIPQDETLVTYAPMIKREQEKISFDKSAKEVYNQVRGLNPWPGSYTTYKGKTVKIWSGMIHDCPNARTHHQHQANGTIVKIFKDAIGVKTGEGIFLITELQVEGKKRMLVKDYLNGNSIFEVDTQFDS